jgi:hypothetical protein
MFVGAAWADETAEDAAQASAEAWLKAVDAGNYDAAWNQAAKPFKGAVTKQRWTQQVGGARGALGRVLARKVLLRTYKERLPGAPDGKYVIIQFETTFEKKASAIETVTPMLDSDGVWRVSGYYIK